MVPRLKYLAFGLTFCIFSYFLLSYTLFCPSCVDFSRSTFVHVINNEEGRVNQLTWSVDGPVNHAYKKYATQSSFYSSEAMYGAHRATDGDVEGTTMSHTLQELNAYLDIDLMFNNTPIRFIRVWDRSDGLMGMSIPFKVFVSKKPLKTDSKTLAWSEVTAEDSIKFSTAKRMYTWLLPDRIEARYIRVQVPSNQFLAVSEVQVFDYPVSDGYQFIPRYAQQNSEAPLVALPSSFSSFLSSSGQALNIAATRAFTQTGSEITAGNYGDVILNNKNRPTLYISKGEDFIGDVKSCIAFLVTNATDMSLLSLDLTTLSANLFLAHLSTIIIFHSRMDTPTIETLRVFFPHLIIQFVNVAEHFPNTLPAHLSSVDTTLFKQGTDCAPENQWPLETLHRARFWTTKLWKYPILQQFDVIIKMDEHTNFDKPIILGSPYFITDMIKKKKKFGYYSYDNFKSSSSPSCSNGIMEATETFAKNKNLAFKHKEKIEKEKGYWPGLLVYSTQFFCTNNDWLAYVDYLDSLGGHYNHKWGEQDILPAALSLFLNFDELYHINNDYLQLFSDHTSVASVELK